MTRDEAHALLYRGQANVAKCAAAVGCELDDLKASFREYVAGTVIDEAVWRADCDS